MTTRAIDPALTGAYETCRRMHRRHDPTYYWATRRLPEEIRPATHALYGYVRTADEIVDGPRRPADPQARRAVLDAWEAELETGLATGHSPQPVIGALVDAGRRHRLPLGELTAYMGSMRVDCAPVRMETWDELVTYMEGSAGSVGRIMAPLLGVPEAHHAGFGRLGLAFQHANFIRDVREDRRLDRIYLPGEDRAPLRRRRRRLRPPDGDRGAARARRARGAPRPRAVRRRRGRRRGRARRRCGRASAWPARSTSACSTASRRSATTCSAAARGCRPGSSRSSRWRR